MHTKTDREMWSEVSLVFGRRKPDGSEVTFAQWERFVRQSIVPRFPAGFSVIDVAGGWLDAKSGRTIEERSKRLSVVLDIPPDNVDLTTFRELAQLYKGEFEQDAVMLAITPADVQFI